MPTVLLARHAQASFGSADYDFLSSTGIEQTELMAAAIAALVAELLGGHPDLFPRRNRVLVNTGITKLAIGRAGVSLISFNEHTHIDDDGGALLTYR